MKRRKPKVETVAFSDHAIGVYDGRLRLGEILIGRTIRAVDAAGVELGTFATIAEATAAVGRAGRSAAT